MAYLTDTEKTQNTFTIGDVKIELLEPNYPGNDDPSLDDLGPNEEVPKDPKVVNTGTNDTVVFMVVDSPMEAITLVNDDGTPVNTQTKTEVLTYTDSSGVDSTKSVASERPQRTVEEMFWFKDSSDSAATHGNSFDPNWTQLEAKSMFIIVDKYGNETQVVFTEDNNPDANSDLDDTTESESLFTGAPSIFDTDVDGTNKLTKRQKALQEIYAKLPEGSRLYHRYVFAYNTDIQGSTMNDDDDVRASAKLGDALSEHETTNLFDKIQMKPFLEGQIDEAVSQFINIRAYAVHDTEILENGSDLASDLTSKTNLNHIYDIFIEQNSEIATNNGRERGIKVVNIRSADSVANTRDGESERKEDGTFGEPSEPHVNRWGTDKEVGDSTDTNANQENLNPNGGGSSGGSSGGQAQPTSGPISFSLNGNDMSDENVEAGTTWGEFLTNWDGPYDTSEEGYLIDQSNQCYLDADGNFIKPDDVILNGGTYYTKEIISFTLVGKNNKPIKLAAIPASYDWRLRLTAEPDMTWREWCDSKYNTYGLTVLSDGKIGESNGERTVKHKNENGYTMFAEDIIEPYGFYWLSELVTEGHK